VTRALAVAVVVALVGALAGASAAEPVALPDTPATVDLPAAWTRGDAEGVVLGARGPAGELLAITRARIPNPDAWRPKTREAYADQIERGIAARTKGYRRLARKVREVNGVPALDVEARRADGATLVIRVLLFRTYALALAIEVPRRLTGARARAIATSFAPPPA